MPEKCRKKRTCPPPQYFVRKRTMRIMYICDNCFFPTLGGGVCVSEGVTVKLTSFFGNNAMLVKLLTTYYLLFWGKVLPAYACFARERGAVRGG